MTDLFLSYKAEDRSRVAPLVQALETDGLSVWWDEHIGGGDEWRDTILRHLESARAVIVVWSKRSIGPQGSFVRDEATRALRRQVYVPIRIDRVDPPLGFGETQALDLVGWHGDRSDHRYQAVLSSVCKRLGIKENAQRLAGQEHATSTRRTVIAGAAAVVVSAAALSTWIALRPNAANSDSIAVLPFANLSGDPNQAYFADGVAEELRNALARIPALKVVARTSSELVRNDDARTAAHKLGVSHILTGSVRRSSSAIRISTQLVDDHGLEQWSEAYDRPSGDALQIQTDIATKVANALRIRLGRSDIQELTAGGTHNAAAQDLLLKARQLSREDDSEGAAQRALGIYDSALALDPHYADALAGKAGILTGFADAAGSTAEKRRQLDAAQQLGRQAVALAPRSPRARAALGFALYLDFKFEDALRQYAALASLSGEPSGDWDYLGAYALMLTEFGRSALALRIADRMVALDPLNPWSHHTRATALYALGRYKDAKAADERALALGPDLAWPRAWLALSLMQMGKLDAAKNEFVKLHPRPGVWTAWEAILEERRGNRTESNRLLNEIRSRGIPMYFQVAEVLAQQGRKDDAIAALEKAWDVRDGGLTSLRQDDMLTPLHGDLRFEAIVKRMSFPA